MIEDIVNLIITSPNYSASNGDNLLGMDYDVFHCFEFSEVFEIGEVKQTGDCKCMFQVTLTVTESVEELHEVKHALKESWEFIQYRYFEASSLTVTHKNTSLRFVTVIGENQFYVTGIVRVSGSKYESLAKNSL